MGDWRMLQQASSSMVRVLAAGRQVVAVSGGFDPLHVGHLRYLQAAAEIGYLVVVVNGDGFLRRKKGVPFMPLAERLECVSAVRGVDLAVGYESMADTVSEALAHLKPDVFAKGGDRVPGTVPEDTVCQALGIHIQYGVGGGKAQSSSHLTGRTVRPWGWYRVVYDGSNALGKVLGVTPGHRFSLQRHAHRDETWVVMTGEGLLVLDGEEQAVRPGDVVRIPRGTVHRLGCTSASQLVFLECQLGEHLEESDIERLADDYGRVHA